MTAASPTAHQPPVPSGPARPLDPGLLAREITAIANGRAIAVEHDVAPRNLARRVAITGSPGAGKSTLSGHLAGIRGKDRRYGILAIDPSSPRSGGAILSDRIRIDEIEGTAELYVRSLGSRSSSDGLADNLPAILDTMDRHGFAEVLLETVGVGQSDYAVNALVDTVVLVLHPESSDVIQAMRAGIMEMADLFVINKADLPSARKNVADIKRVQVLTRRSPSASTPPVLSTSSRDPSSIAALSDAIDAHLSWLAATGAQSRQRLRLRYVLRRALDARVSRALDRMPEALCAQAIDEQLAWTLNVPRIRIERSDRLSF